MRTGNPALNKQTFQDLTATGERMTISGTVNKTGLLLAILLIPAIFVWDQFFTSYDTSTVYPYMIGGLIGGFIVAMITVFKKNLAPYTAPIYAALEGLLLGGLSAVFESMYPGIVLQAVGLTFGTLFALLAAYKSGMIKVTENFKLGVIAATGGIALVYFISIILSFFGIQFPLIHEGGLFGIIFSLVVVVIAALNLVLDFDFIEKGEENGAPKYMEWYAAFGLMVTLVWLYIELLRLLSKMRR